MKKEIKKTVQIPEKIEVKIELPRITIKGPLGSVEKIFKIKNIDIKKEDNIIEISHKKALKKDKKIINSIASHIAAMIKGVIEGYEYELQICSTHFPTSVKIDKEKNLLVVKNFLGENKDRIVKIIKDVEIKIEGDRIKVSSLNKELAGQQAANIETATKIKKRDKRVFQDGIWIAKKEKGRSH